MFSSEKAKGANNFTSDELKELTEKWEKLEKNNFILALRPKSFREGKQAFDKCVETGES